MSEKIRSRLWCLLLYPEDITHASAMEAIRKEYNYVAILHDKDEWSADDEAVNPDHKAGTLKKSHYHVILKFTQARWNTALASDLGITANYIERCRNFDNAALYLVHDGLDEKYQYDSSLLEGPLVPAVMKLLADTDENSRVLELMKLIKSMGYIEFEDLVIEVCKQGMYGDFRRMGYSVIRIVDRHNEMWKQEMEAQIDRINHRETFSEHTAWFSNKPINKEDCF